MSDSDEDKRPMSQDERLTAIQYLLTRRSRWEQSPKKWLAEIRVFFESTEGLRALVDALPSRSDILRDHDEITNITKILDVALRRLESGLEPSLATWLRLAADRAAEEAAKPAASQAAQQAAEKAAKWAVERAIDDRVHILVDRAVWQSAPVRVGRWLLPSTALVVVMLVAGGTLYGAIQVSGIINLANQARTDITKARNDAIDAAAADLGRMKNEQSAAIKQWFATAKQDLETERTDRQRDIKDAAKRAQDTVETQAKTAWADTQRNGTLALDARRDVIFAVFDQKQGEVQTRIDGMLATLPKKVEDLGKKIDLFQEAEARIDAALAQKKPLEKLASDVKALTLNGNVQWLLQFYKWNGVALALSALLSIGALILSVRAFRKAN
jgi:hypothetical protein